mgnify:CR=1 FL=1
MSLESLLIPFRFASTAAPTLPAGYRLLESPMPASSALNRLLACCGEQPRSADCWSAVLTRSVWHFAVLREPDLLVGFVRITSDMALNANLWDLSADHGDPAEAQIYGALVGAALAKLRRELGGCSISLAAPPQALRALEQNGFVIDPGGIRAMELRLT